MKLTKQRLKRIIQEELLSELNPPAYIPSEDEGDMHLGDDHEHSTDEYHDLMRRVEELVEAWTPPADNEAALQYKQDLADLVTDFGCGCKDMGGELAGSTQHQTVPALPTSDAEPMQPPLAGSMY